MIGQPGFSVVAGNWRAGDHAVRASPRAERRDLPARACCSGWRAWQERIGGPGIEQRRTVTSMTPRRRKRAAVVTGEDGTAGRPCDERSGPDVTLMEPGLSNSGDNLRSQ